MEEARNTEWGTLCKLRLRMQVLYYFYSEISLYYKPSSQILLIFLQNLIFVVHCPVSRPVVLCSQRFHQPLWFNNLFFLFYLSIDPFTMFTPSRRATSFSSNFGPTFKSLSQVKLLIEKDFEEVKRGMK